jgi:hypothetical protein
VAATASRYAVVDRELLAALNRTTIERNLASPPYEAR